MDLTVVFRLVVALCLGLIIGLERGWKNRESPSGQRVAGIRSFAFVALFGGLSALLAAKVSALILAIAFLGLALIVAISYGLTARETRKFGITTELSLLITFILGGLAVTGMVAEALAVSVVVAVLLGLKAEMHQVLERLERRELLATLQLLIIAAVALPLLPDQNLGPWNALNPRAIGLIVLLIAGISYLGYFAMRILGSRVGLLATAFFGGLVSSTAVTVAFGRMARHRQGSLAVLGTGISLAAGMMALRILVEVAIVNPALLNLLVVPISMLAAIPLLAAGVIATRQIKTESGAEVPLKNPIELRAALIYGGILSGLFILIRAVEVRFGDAGVYALSAISGITDVDAVSLSLAQATRTNLSLTAGATGILTAAMVNTGVKALLAILIGGWKLARWCATILLTALGLALIMALWIKP
jgi:uncharacterized membrane protein (DUF4010 family)